jgi:hypothetical protein
LYKRPGFTIADGWELLEWERDLTIKNKKGVNVTTKHKVNYLIHTGYSTIDFNYTACNRNTSGYNYPS